LPILVDHLSPWQSETKLLIFSKTMERLEIENSEEENEVEDDHDEPVGCSMEGIVTFSVGLVAGTFSALICKVRLFRLHNIFLKNLRSLCYIIFCTVLCPMSGCLRYHLLWSGWCGEALCEAYCDASVNVL